ncbi:TIGR03960 family B12-binding radical SAM protein [bacterium]|nr:TIGR03960 family B12-binding radical SAM protein [bacterium]
MNKLFETLERKVLPFVSRPGRYTGGEAGPPEPERGPVRLRLALVYPDLYEVGMSNLGLKILHAVASKVNGVAVERAFAPWPDMQERMRAASVPLYGLESFTPLKDFHLVGITLQSELTYTNILSVLDLSGIPVLAAERGESDPLVCAGGPCAVNPEVLAPFFDFFVLGDGEETLRMVLERLLGLQERGACRAERLAVLRGIPGVYVPGAEPPSGGDSVEVRRVHALEPEAAPGPFPAPLIELSQHHLAVEIMRGCTCGCRFCQAGMFYRPVRVRDVESIVEAVRRGIREAGWDSVTLLSLSAADHPAITELVTRLLPETRAAGVRLSFPSLRVDSRILPLLEELEQGKKSGLTFAVEAGSERLRRVIGKKVEEEDLVHLVEEAYRRGWNLVKLYFMVGLPTETAADIDEIARLINRIASLGRGLPGRRSVNITVSPFVPKPGTPFQWEAQDRPEATREKIERIRRQVRSRNVQVKYHEPESSALEGVLARGDRRLAAVILAAWRSGAQFDGWWEYFSWKRWLAAFEACGLDPAEFMASREPGAPLPWAFVRQPVSGEFLASQREAAFRAENVTDCREGRCHLCGAEEASLCRSLRSVEKAPEDREGKSDVAPPRINLLTPETDRRLWRVRYAKLGRLRYTGHLDMVRNIEFLLRRSGTSVLYSGGFTPRMRLSFSPPLPLGLESRAEYFDLETLPLAESELRAALERAAAPLGGFELLELKAMPAGVLPPLAQDIVAALWSARLESGEAPSGSDDWEAFIAARRQALLDEGGVLEYTDRKEKAHRLDLRAALGTVSVETEAGGGVRLDFRLDLQGEAACRADRFLQYVHGCGPETAAAWCIRKETAFCADPRRSQPLDF